MASPIEICNQALGHIGSGKQIDAFDEKSTAAENCRLYYESARRRTLRQFDWPFARDIADLVEVDGVTPARPFTTVYAMPVGVAFRGIEKPELTYRTVPFKIFGNRIHTSQLAARGIYTMDVEDPELADEGFAYVMGWALAVDLANPITKSDAKSKMAFEMFLRMKSVAEMDSANEEPTKIPDLDSGETIAPWHAARGS